MKLDWNNRTEVLEHLHHLVWIQSHTHNWLQHLLNGSVCLRGSTSLLGTLLGTLSTHTRLIAESQDTSGTSLLW
jgi:hypothetical protein